MVTVDCMQKIFTGSIIVRTFDLLLRILLVFAILIIFCIDVKIVAKKEVDLGIFEIQCHETI